ncbi:MAG: hypothetical protein ACYTHJ_03490 [Planctomycetota bacterium]|jgi:hypothetical protein
MKMKTMAGHRAPHHRDPWITNGDSTETSRSRLIMKRANNAHADKAAYLHVIFDAWYFKDSSLREKQDSLALSPAYRAFTLHRARVWRSVDFGGHYGFADPIEFLPSDTVGRNRGSTCWEGMRIQPKR